MDNNFLINVQCVTLKSGKDTVFAFVKMLIVGDDKI